MSVVAVVPVCAASAILRNWVHASPLVRGFQLFWRVIVFLRIVPGRGMYVSVTASCVNVFSVSVCSRSWRSVHHAL